MIPKEMNGGFWVRTPTASVFKSLIEPSEYFDVDSLEFGDSSCGKTIINIQKENREKSE